MNKDILEGNKIIAAFDPNMEVDTSDPKEESWFRNVDTWVHLANLKYHSSWDWLMPVVEKIEWLDSTEVDCAIKIERQECRISFFKDQINSYYHTVGGKPKMESVWQSVVQFIQWYNTQKHPTP